MFNPKRLLVTGSAGFIGSHFVHSYLRNNSHAFILSVDKLTYASSREYLLGIDPIRHQLVVGDITNASLMSQLLREYEIDTIVHFAAESHVDRSIESPQAFIETNIIGTFILLEAAKQYWLTEQKWNEQFCRFHHVSTDEVYGSLTSNAPAFTERHAYQPNSPYSASKASSDHLVRAYYHTYGLPVTLSNCSNNYGPHQHHEKLIPTVIKACLENRSIPLYGSGKNVRDWLFVEDHVNAIECIIKNGMISETYNIGGESEKTNQEVVGKICDWMDLHCPRMQSYRQLITPVADRLGHDWRYAMNIEKIKNELGWQPQTSFEKGLGMTIAYYVKQYSDKKALSI